MLSTRTEQPQLSHLSRAGASIKSWERARHGFVKVMPTEYKRALVALEGKVSHG